MKERDWLKLIVWGICTLFVIDWAFTWLSIKTKCFIGINF